MTVPETVFALTRTAFGKRPRNSPNKKILASSNRQPGATSHDRVLDLARG